MAFERNPKFYSELKQANDDILRVVESFHKKSPYFDYSSSFRDYIKHIEDLRKKFPVLSNSDESQNRLNNSNNSTGNLFGNSTQGSNNDTSLSTNPLNNNTSIENNTTIFAPSLAATITTEQKSSPFFLPDTTTANNQSESAARGEEGEEDSAPPQPNVDKFEEPDAKYQARCKLYERLLGNPNVSSSHALLGCGTLFIKEMDTSTKLHLIVRQDPDLRKVLLNQVITASTPLRQLAKAIQLIVPGEDGKTNCYVAKVKDDKIASEIYQLLNSVREAR